MTLREALDLLPEVKWDRYAGTHDNYVLYGWITRPLAQRDFVLLAFKNSIFDSCATSSTRYSAEFAERFGLAHTHMPDRPASELLGTHVTAGSR